MHALARLGYIKVAQMGVPRVRPSTRMRFAVTPLLSVKRNAVAYARAEQINTTCWGRMARLPAFFRDAWFGCKTAPAVQAG